MSICKSVLNNVIKQAKALNINIASEQADSIAQKTENIVLELLNESAEICFADKRKILTSDDIKQAVASRGLDFLESIFE